MERDRAQSPAKPGKEGSGGGDHYLVQVLLEVFDDVGAHCLAELLLARDCLVLAPGAGRHGDLGLLLCSPLLSPSLLSSALLLFPFTSIILLQTCHLTIYTKIEFLMK